MNAPIFLDDKGHKYTKEGLIEGIKNHTEITNNGGDGCTGGDVSLGNIQFPQDLIAFTKQKQSEGKCPKYSSRTGGKTQYANRVKDLYNLLKSKGQLCDAASLCACSMVWMESGFHPDSPSCVEPTELKRRGICFAGEGIVGFTDWPQKQKIINLTNPDYPQFQVCADQSAYPSSGKKICDAPWGWHAMSYYEFIKTHASSLLSQCSTFADYFGALLLLKAGQGGGGAHGNTLLERAINRSYDYERCHAGYGYAVHNAVALGCLDVLVTYQILQDADVNKCPIPDL